MNKRIDNLLKTYKKAERVINIIAGIFIGIYAKDPIGIILAIIGIMIFAIAYHFISNVLLYTIISREIEELNAEED